MKLRVFKNVFSRMFKPATRWKVFVGKYSYVFLLESRAMLTVLNGSGVVEEQIAAIR